MSVKMIRSVEAIQISILVVCFVIFIWAAIVGAKESAKQMTWLRMAAAETHGWIDREATGDTVWTNSDGHPTGSTVNWHYFVRTPSGRRIEYGDKYEAEL